LYNSTKEKHMVVELSAWERFQRGEIDDETTSISRGEAFAKKPVKTEVAQESVSSILEKITEGFPLEKIDPIVAEKLTHESQPQLKEFGQLMLDPKRTALVEYQARLARAREVVGLDDTNSEPTMRERLTWEAGESVDLKDLLNQVKDNEEIQFTDYKGRHYSIIKEPHQLTLMSAYDENGRSLVESDSLLRKVEISTFKTRTDLIMESFGAQESSVIVLVKVGTEVRNTPRGEVYDEVRGGRVSKDTAVVRMQLSLPETNKRWGVLVSKIEIVSQSPEAELLATVQWRIADSISELKGLVGLSQSDQGAIKVGDGEVSHFHFSDNGSLQFYHFTADGETMTEYFFSPVAGSMSKEYVKVGQSWNAVMVRTQRRDGFVDLNPLKAVRLLDQFRYAIVATQNPAESEISPTETPAEVKASASSEYEAETLVLTFEGKSYQIPADYDQDRSVFLLPDGRVLTYDTIRGDVPAESDLTVAENMSDIIFRGLKESLVGLSKEELRQKLAAVGRVLVEAK
jgi:hypothetical protein